MPGVLAFIELRAGGVRSVSHEVVTAARTLADALGDEVHALLLGGPGADEGASALAEFGADTVLVGEREDLARYSAEEYAGIAADLIRERSYRIAIFPASAMGKDLAPRVAARLGAGYAAECTAIEVSEGELRATRPRFAGKVFATVAFEGEPVILSIRPNAFTPQAHPTPGKLEALDLGGRRADFGAIVREVRAAAGQKLDVAEASVVVSGGRGLKEPENFRLVEELAEALGGAVGASRAVVDAGWRPHAEQVGQTGKTVSPQLYIAIGISGAIQHLAGMRTSRCIVAINKDPNAPIFKVADYGIVGDLFEIVPRLTEEIRKLGG